MRCSSPGLAKCSFMDSFSEMLVLHPGSLPWLAMNLTHVEHQTMLEVFGYMFDPAWASQDL